jgi:GH15 family glucan-1,4-alpha-glucosidase
MARIEEYGLIGDLQTAALVCRDGSIDWCCFPRFDSGACFAALLGDRENGRWLVAPRGEAVRSTRQYRPGTLILETVFETSAGAVRVIDFMPPRDRAPDIVRIVEGLRGEVEMISELVIRFDFGRIVPWVRRHDDTLLAVAGPDALCMRTPVEVHGEDMRSISRFRVTAGERVPFVLTWFPSHHRTPPKATDAEQTLERTESFWSEWSSACSCGGDYADHVRRSLLVLKALTYAPTGGIVAAPTTSLPEMIGGQRNWDYRFCWLRDAALTLHSMLSCGYRTEALAWRDWLLRAVAGDPTDLQILYGVAGERRLDEREVEWLDGYEGSRPVRVGNDASAQTQLDVYGEVLDTIYQTRVHGAPPDHDAWALMIELVKWLEDGWRREDAGIWEVRGPERHFTHSKVMAWVAFDRAVRLADRWRFSERQDLWRGLRDEVHAEVLARAWSPRKRAFTQYYGSEELDASLLRMPLVGFLPATDPRMVATAEAIDRELSSDGLIHRYRARTDGAVDGFTHGEGAFLPCSFWMVSVLALQGRQDEARRRFEALLLLANDLGLFAEEFDPTEARQVGNFPQALTHLALVDAATHLTAGAKTKLT